MLELHSRAQQALSSRLTRTRGRAPSMLDVQDSLLPTTLADTEATCNRCLRLRGEGTRRVTIIPEISPLAQSFLSAVRLQCSDLTQYPSNTHAPSLCKVLSSSGWVSPRTITVARFQVHIRFIVQLSGCGAALVALRPCSRLQQARGLVLRCWPGV